MPLSQTQIESMFDLSYQLGHSPDWLSVRKAVGPRAAFKIRASSMDKSSEVVFFRQDARLRAEAPWFPFSEGADREFRGFLYEYYMRLNKVASTPAFYAYDEEKDQIVIFTDSLVGSDHNDGKQFYLISRETIICKCDEFHLELADIDNEWRNHKKIIEIKTPGKRRKSNE